MKCPFCSHAEDKVIDSRESKEGDVIRRRRQCLKCDRRFTSYERIEDIMPMVIKKDGRREPFDRDKIIRGLEKALEKRPVSIEQRDNVVEGLARKIQALGVKEIPCSQVGEEVMACLRDIDKVAYVRFASVYREFKDINEFMEELERLLKKPEKKHKLKGV